MELIKQALEAPGVYVFGELLDMPSIQVCRLRCLTHIPVQDLENGPHASHLTLLNMFAYGTYRSLTDNAANLPSLSDVMIRKLRQLTMVGDGHITVLRLIFQVSLAEKSKLLPYSLLQTELDISTVRELEDLIIEVALIGILW